MDSSRFREKLREKFQLDFKRQCVLWKPLLLIFFAVIPANTIGAQQTFKLTVAGHFSVSNEGFQYRHVEISTSNGLPAAKDISVWCHVEAMNHRSLGRGSRMIQPIPVTLKAGKVRVEKELYLPSEAASGVASFSLTASDSDRKRLLESPWSHLGDHCQHVLIVDGTGVSESQVTFNRNRRATQPVHSLQGQQSIGRCRGKGSEIYFFSSHSKIAYLPERWIGYSSIEQVIINSEDLVTLTKDTERFEALTQWVTMGGSLIVSDCGDDFRCIALLRRYFKTGESGGVPKMTLYTPDEGLESDCERLSDLYIQSSGKRSIDLSKLGVSNTWTEVEGMAGKDGGLMFSAGTKVLLHQFGLGQMMFYSDPVMDQADTGLLKYCMLCVTAQQHENVLGAKNSAGVAYNQSQLLNVGIAPIGLFIFVVLSFMTLIGPVGYSYLKVKQKLNYQIWLVPLASALACLSLLGYAFLSEGVGTKLRPTLYVELDQHRKVAATFARYSVYSALQPPPYRFEDDQFATLESTGDGIPAIYYWADDGYRLTGGNASARNVHQVFVAAPVKTNSGIGLKKPADSESSNTLSLTNNFHDRVRLLVVKFDGDIYFVTDLPPSDTQVTKPAVEDEFTRSDDVRKLLSELFPINSQTYRYNPRRRFYNRGAGQSQGEWDIGVEHIEKFRLARGIQIDLEEGHYIAILDSMKEVPAVVAGAREIDGSVIVHGKW